MQAHLHCVDTSLAWGVDGKVPPHWTRTRQGIMDHTCSSRPAEHIMQSGSSPLLSSPFFSMSPNALLQRPLKETKTNGIQNATAVIDKRFIWEDEWGEWWSCLLRIHSPHLSGSTWQRFWAIQQGERYAGAFLFSHRCIKLSWAKQQMAESDAQEEKCFVRPHAVHFGENLNKVAV